MELRLIGLGKMDANMAERLVGGSHRVVGFDLNRASISDAVDVGVENAEISSLRCRRLASSGSWCPSGGPSIRPLEGSQTLFVRANKVEASWRLYDPVLDYDPEPYPYAAGTRGPVAADGRLAIGGEAWTRD